MPVTGLEPVGLPVGLSFCFGRLMSCPCDGSVESGLLCFGKEFFDDAWFEVFFECGFEVAECVGVDVCGVGGAHGGAFL